MISRMKKVAIAAGAALAMTVGAVAVSTPAEAYWRGGGGGWHGGGWHGGWGGHAGWRGGYGGWGWRGAGWGVAGVGVGLYSAPYWGGGYYGYPATAYDSCVRVRPAYDNYGNFVGRRAVNVCR